MKVQEVSGSPTEYWWPEEWFVKWNCVKGMDAQAWDLNNKRELKYGMFWAKIFQYYMREI